MVKRTDFFDYLIPVIGLKAEADLDLLKPEAAVVKGDNDRFNEGVN